MAYRATANTEQRKQQVHASILKAGKTLVSEAGFRALSMAAVAERAGIATGTLYRYFSSKAELYAEVLSAVSQREVDVLTEIAGLVGHAQRLEIDEMNDRRRANEPPGDRLRQRHEKADRRRHHAAGNPEQRRRDARLDAQLQQRIPSGVERGRDEHNRKNVAVHRLKPPRGRRPPYSPRGDRRQHPGSYCDSSGCGHQGGFGHGGVCGDSWHDTYRAPRKQLGARRPYRDSRGRFYADGPLLISTA